MRNQVLAGGFVNTTTVGPLVDGDRRLAYTWNFSVGVEHQIANNMAVTADYVGNRGYDNTAPIDINEGRSIQRRAASRAVASSVRP